MDRQDMYYDQMSPNSDMVAKKVMVGVYGWMTLALIITAISAIGILYTPYVEQIMRSYWIFAIAELILVIVLSARAHKMSKGGAVLAFFGYAILNGLTLTSIFLVYDLGIIGKAFIVTAVLFGVMTVYGYITKTDLTAIGNLFVMGLFGVIIATFVNFFFMSTGLDIALTYIGVFLFIGLIGYDTQRIKGMAYTESYGGMRNASILGALVLYLDFINLFLRLLRLFARNND